MQMASIKVKFSPSDIADREGTIYYGIRQESKQRRLDTHYHIYASEWNDSRGVVVLNPASERRSHLLAIRERIGKDMERLNRIIQKFEMQGLPYSADDIVDEFKRHATEYGLLNFMDGLIKKLKRNGKVRTSETYTAARNSFRRFLCEGHKPNDILLDCLNSEIMEEYEAWLRQRGVSPNTISFYTRILRAVYNRAVENEIIENRYPFKHVYTGIEKTMKRALPLSVIKAIKELDLSMNPSHDFARDMFIMSFMLRGMSFIDMAFLRKSDLSNGYITYRRRKTGQQLIIRWTQDMQMILDKYPMNRTEYLLPIIRDNVADERNSYRNAGYNINYNLKRISQKLGVSIPLTLYVARHSWASAAKSKGVPLSIISEGLGHDSEMTTRIYLTSLDTSVVDEVNSLILGSI